MKTFVGCAVDVSVRYQATSGGIGSSLLKYLFDTGKVQTAISFTYNKEILQYEPILIYDFQDYRQVGSIYHEIKLVQFVKQNITQIHGDIACFCLPCQALSLRKLIENSGRKCFLLGLTCSSQQSIDATYYLLKCIHIPLDKVTYIQYRGNGWPSGVQIETIDHEKIFVPNNDSVWTKIFHSRLFIQSRCFKCTNTLNQFADVSLLDPWLPEYLKDNSNSGKTLVIAYSSAGLKILEDAFAMKYIYLDKIDQNAINVSQGVTIRRKRKYQERRNVRRILMWMHKSHFYRSHVLSSPFLFKLHGFVLRILEK